MANETFNLAILLSLKDTASSGLSRFEAQLRSAAKEGKEFVQTFEKIRAALNKDINSKGFSVLVKDLNKAQKEGKETISVFKSIQTALNKDLKSKGFSSITKDFANAEKEGKQALSVIKSLQNAVGKGFPNKGEKLANSVKIGKKTRADSKERNFGYRTTPDDELDRVAGKSNKRGNIVNKLANLNDKVIEPGRQIGDTWKREYDSLKKYTDESTRLYRLQERFKLINLSPAENEKVFSAIKQNVKDIRGIGLADSQALFTDIYNALGNVDSAIAALPMASKYQVATSAINGDIYSPEEIKTQIQKGFKFMELTGATKDRASMESRFDTLTKISNSTGGEVTMAKLLALSKQASPAVQGLSEKGIYNITSVVDEMGGDRAGTALSAMYRAWVGGIMKQPVAERYQELGLIKEGGIEYNKSGKLKSIKPGANILGDLMSKDPLAAVDRLAEVIKIDAAKKGIDVSTPELMNKQLRGLMGTETQFRLVNALMNNRGQVEKESSRAENSKGAIATYNQLKDENSPLLKIKEYEAAWVNFQTTAGTPLLQTLGKLSEAVTPIMSFFGDHPTITQWTMAAIIGLKTFKGFAETASILKGSGFLSFFSNATTQASSMGSALGGATSKATGLKNSIKNIGNRQFGIGVKVGAILGLYEAIQYALDKASQAGEAQKRTSEGANKTHELWQSAEADLIKRTGKGYEQPEIKGQADRAWFTSLTNGLDTATEGKNFQKQSSLERVFDTFKQTIFHPVSSYYGAENKFTGFGYKHDKNTMATGFKQFAPELKDPRIMAEVLKQLETRIPNKAEQKPVKDALQTAFPESFNTAISTLGESFRSFSTSFLDLSIQQKTAQESFSKQSEYISIFGQNLQGLDTPISTAKQGVSDLGGASTKSVGQINNLAASAGSVANGLNSVAGFMFDWRPPTPQIQTITIGVPSGGVPSGKTNPTSGGFVPSHAVGGVVERDGMAYLHAGNVITPAKTTKGLQGFSTLMSLARNQSNISNPTSNNIHSVNSAIFNYAGDSAQNLRQPQSPLMPYKADFVPEKSASPSVVLPNRVIDGMDNRRSAEARAGGNSNLFSAPTFSNSATFNSMEISAGKASSELNNFSTNIEDWRTQLNVSNASAANSPVQNRQTSVSNQNSLSNLINYGGAVNNRQENQSVGGIGALSYSSQNTGQSFIQTLNRRKDFQSSTRNQNNFAGDLNEINTPGRDAGRDRQAGFESVKNSVASSASGDYTFTYSPQVTINGADKKAEIKFLTMLNEHAQEIDRLVARKMQNGRIRA